MATLNFNASNYTFDDNEGGGFDPIPEGYYHVVAIDSEIRETKAGNGRYIQFKFEITDAGPFQGRYVWDRFNMQNPNPKAVEIAQENLARFCQAAGLNSISDSFELHHRPVKVKIAQREWNGQIQNEIKGYRRAELGNATMTQPKKQDNNLPF